MNKIIAKIVKVLKEIDFVNRYNVLRENHAHENYFENPNAQKIQAIIENYGYFPEYTKTHAEEFTIGLEEGNKISVALGMSIGIGIVQFHLLVFVDKVDYGAPFGVLSREIEPVRALPPPRFANYKELEEIIKEGLCIYEDIRDRLLPLLTK